MAKGTNSGDTTQRRSQDTAAGRLRLVSVTMMGSEADIAESFVRANLRFLDHMRIALNNAHDGTADILDALVREGLPITVSTTPSGRYAQLETVNRLARQAIENDTPDWLIPLDADEFIDAPDRATLEATLASQGDRHVRVAWLNHVPTPDDPAGEPLKCIRHCYDYPPPAPETNPWVWKLFANVSLFTPSVDRYQIGVGGHRIERSGTGIESPQPTAPLDSVRLRHFPVRSRDQLLLKGGLGWLALKLAEGAKPDIGLHWQRLDRIARERDGDSILALQEATRHYLDYGRLGAEALADTPIVCSPYPFPVENRYDAARLPAAMTLLNWFDAVCPDGRLPAAGAGDIS